MQERLIRVLIVDDHPLVRLGLTALLEVCDDLELAGEAKNGKEAVELAEQLQPDVILMDLIMPIMDGVTATRIIRQKLPHIQVVVLTSSIDFELIQKAQDAGAYSYMFKNVTIDMLANTIRAAVLL